MLTCGFSEVNPYTDQFGYESRLRMLEPRIQQWLELPDDTTLAEYEAEGRRITVRGKDLAQLLARDVLSSQAMVVVFEYLQSICDDRAGTHDIALMHTLDLERLQSAEFTFLPVFQDNHWSLLVVARRQGRCLVYDSSDDDRHRELAANSVVELSSALGQDLETVKISTPHQTNPGDGGVLVCEISALLVRRLLETAEGEYPRVCMGLYGMSFSVEAGRGHILTLIASHPLIDHH